MKEGNGDLGQIREDIGALKSDTKNAARQRDQIAASVDEIKGTLADLKPVLESVAKHEEEIAALKAFRNRIYGYAGAVSVGMSIAASWLKDHFTMTGGPQ